MNGAMIAFLAAVIVAYLAFIGGCIVGGEPMEELKRNGYKIVKHEVRHGDFYTNWVEVVKEEGAKDGK